MPIKKNPTICFMYRFFCCNVRSLISVTWNCILRSWKSTVTTIISAKFNCIFIDAKYVNGFAMWLPDCQCKLKQLTNNFSIFFNEPNSYYAKQLCLVKELSFMTLTWIYSHPIRFEWNKKKKIINLQKTLFYVCNSFSGS